MSSHLIKFFLLLFASIKIAELEAHKLSEVQSNKLEIVQGATTETILQIFWFLPLTVTNPSTYEAKIASNERHFTVQNIGQLNNKTTSGDATFYPLTPGKFYNVTVKVQIKNGTDFIIKNTKEFQLAPMIPSNVTINHASITDTSFELNWDVPAILSEFDGYKITIFDNKKTVRSALLLKREKSRIFRDLNPGKKYTIVMKTYAKNLESSSVVKNISTLDPISSIPMEIKILNRKNLLINYWEDSMDFRDQFFLITQTRKDTGETIQKLTNQPNVVFYDFYPGAAYKIRIFKLDNDDEEIIGHGNAIAPPNPPTNITIKEIKNQYFSVLISWNTPMDTIFDGYKIFVGTEDDIVPKKIETINNNLTNQIEVTNLIPGTIHIFRVAAISFGVESLSFEHCYYTVRPAPPLIVNLTAISSKEVQAMFCKPKGKFDTYRGNFSQYHNVSFPEENFNIAAGAYSKDCEILKFIDLKPGQIYKLSIWTELHDVQSEVDDFLVVTPDSNIPANDYHQNVVANNITEPFKIKVDKNFYKIMKS